MWAGALLRAAVPVVTSAQVRPDLFLVHEEVEHGINLLLLRAGTEALLVDTGFPAAEEELRRHLATLGVTRVTQIVHTHRHWDHRGGSRLIAEASVLIQPERDTVPVALTEGKEVRVVAEEMRFGFGTHGIRVFHRRGGHSAANLVVQIEDLEHVHAGDLYFSESFPVVVREEGATVAEHFVHLRWMAAAFPSARFVSSHGRTTTVTELTDYLARIEDSVCAVRSAFARGESPERMLEQGVLREAAPLAARIPFVTERFWIETIRAELPPRAGGPVP